MVPPCPLSSIRPARAPVAPTAPVAARARTGQSPAAQDSGEPRAFATLAVGTETQEP